MIINRQNISRRVLKLLYYISYKLPHLNKKLQKFLMLNIQSSLMIQKMVTQK